MKGKVQATVSMPEELMLRVLAEASGHSVSLIAGRAITEWLQLNYRDQVDLYDKASMHAEALPQ